MAACAKSQPASLVHPTTSKPLPPNLANLPPPEINAASTISALVLSRYFDLTSTYFIISGIAGVNPVVGTIGSVAIARYAVQVGLEYEIATSDNLTDALSSRAGYIPLGAKTPNAYPVNIYGTEVFELNVHLRNKALGLAQKANLTDSTTAKNYRAHYPKAPANKPPQVFKGDTETSDGKKLSLSQSFSRRSPALHVIPVMRWC